jgi:hypothetical protein
MAFQYAYKSQPAWLISRLLIALHSPSDILETGPRMCPPEKSQTVTRFSVEQSVLCSPVYGAIIAKNGHVSRIPQERTEELLCS